MKTFPSFGIGASIGNHRFRPHLPEWASPTADVSLASRGSIYRPSFGFVWTFDIPLDQPASFTVVKNLNSISTLPLANRNE